nr:putative reverse transcriptase domain-containing protein [Tanacetum cinerariifolium]
MLTRWRSRVASRSSSPTTSTPEIPTAPILPAPFTIVTTSSEFPLAPVVTPPRIHQRRAILIRPWEDILIGRLYRTLPGGPCRALTTRKSFLIQTYITKHHHYLSTPPRFVYLPLARTPWCSEAYLHWRSVPLSTMYPPTTSMSLAGDSSFDLSAGPSHKRCRSAAATVTPSIHATRALVPSRVDLLLPGKRFRDSISPEYSVEEDIDMDVLEDVEADAMAIEVKVDMDVKAKVDAGIVMEVDVGVDVEDKVESSDRGTIEARVDVVAGIDIPDGILIPDAVEPLDQVKEGLQDIYEHVKEIPLQRIEDIEMGQRELEARSLIAGGKRSSLLEQEIGDIHCEAFGFSSMMLCMDFRLVVELVASAVYEATRAANALEVENQSQNGSDGDNGNGGDRNGGNGNPNENDRGARHVARECTYQDFKKCQPLNFKGTKGIVRELMKLMAKVYCPRNEIQKMESKLWNLIVKNNDLAAYTQIFQELTMLYTKMVLEEEDRVEKFIGGLPDNIQGNVIAAELTRLQDLANHHAVIVCDEKIMWIPYGDEVLIVQGDRSDKGKKSKLSIISCDKTYNYIKRGCLISLAQIAKKKTKDKSKENRFEDVPIVRDFLEVFPEDLPGLPSMRQVKFQIDLVSSVAPVTHTSYRLAPIELQELSTQLQELSNSYIKFKPMNSPTLC